MIPTESLDLNPYRNVHLSLTTYKKGGCGVEDKVSESHSLAERRSGHPPDLNIKRQSHYLAERRSGHPPDLNIKRVSLISC